jgi:ABC-type phosphate transport system substrate-binding protein
MKTNQLALAMTAVMALGGHTASAAGLTPSDTPDQEITLSGATAQDNNIGLLFKDICVSGTLSEFRDGQSGTAGSNHRAYFCQIDGAKFNPPLSASNPKVLFHKTSTSNGVGGSGLGANPVLAKQAVQVMSINNGNCVAPAGSEAYYRCRITQSGDVTNKVPDAGVTDVNPELFTLFNTPAGVAPVDPNKTNLLQVKSGGALVFGAPVNLELYKALQTAQAKTVDGGSEGAVAAEVAANMPTLSKTQIADIMTGKYKTWAEFGDANGMPNLDVPNGTDTDAKIHICRRTDGSGTQATINAKILAAPCTDSNPAPARFSNPVGPVVLLNAGSGDVEKCLVDFNDGTDTSGQNPGNKKAWAIGVQSTERNKNETLKYRFTKIDGKVPSINAAAATPASSRYDVTVEVTYQWLKSGGPTGDMLKIIDKVATDASKPSIIATNNAGFTHKWGQGGYLALQADGYTIDNPFVISNPVSPWTQLVGGVLDNCAAPDISQ